MRRLRLLPCLLAVLCACACFSCAGVPVLPGEKKVAAANIAAEYYNIGEGYFALKNYEKAAGYYKRVLDNPEYGRQAEYRLARCYAFLKQWKDSARLYRSLIEQDPENTNLRLSLAWVLASSGDNEGALAIYEELLARDDYEPAVLQNMILLYTAQGDFESAEKNLALFRERFPENTAAASLEEKIKLAKEPPETTDTKKAPPPPVTDTKKAPPVTAPPKNPPSH